MFTGLIREIGKVVTLLPMGKGKASPFYYQSLDPPQGLATVLPSMVPALRLLPSMGRWFNLN